MTEIFSDFNILRFGASGDGMTKNTSIIQKAIDMAAACGGGTVFFPAGIYVTGTLYLKDNTGLELSPGAVLLGSPDKEDYNSDDAWVQNWKSDAERVSGAHLIVAVEKKNVFIRGGRIDGNGQIWLSAKGSDPYWGAAKFGVPGWRPAQMVYFCECQGVQVENVELFHASYWTCFVFGCENVFINQVRVWNDFATPNGDGIDVDSSRFVTISNCQIYSGDDSITLRAAGENRLKNDRACEHITITNCILATPCNAFRIGVGEGCIQNVTIDNIIIHDTRTGICIINNYTKKGRGALIRNISFNNIRLETIRPFFISANVYGIPDLPCKQMYDISFNQLRGSGQRSSIIQGNFEQNLSCVSLCDVWLKYEGGKEIVECLKQKGYYADFDIKTSDAALHLENLQDIRLANVRILWGEHLEGPWRTGLESKNIHKLEMFECDFSGPDVKKN